MRKTFPRSVIVLESAAAAAAVSFSATVQFRDFRGNARLNDPAIIISDLDIGTYLQRERERSTHSVSVRQRLLYSHCSLHFRVQLDTVSFYLANEYYPCVEHRVTVRHLKSIGLK